MKKPERKYDVTIDVVADDFICIKVYTEEARSFMFELLKSSPDMGKFEQLPWNGATLGDILGSVLGDSPLIVDDSEVPAHIHFHSYSAYDVEEVAEWVEGSWREEMDRQEKAFRLLKTIGREEDEED